MNEVNEVVELWDDYKYQFRRTCQRLQAEIEQRARLELQDELDELRSKAHDLYERGVVTKSELRKLTRVYNNQDQWRVFWGEDEARPGRPSKAAHTTTKRQAWRLELDTSKAIPGHSAGLLTAYEPDWATSGVWRSSWPVVYPVTWYVNEDATGMWRPPAEMMEPQFDEYDEAVANLYRENNYGISWLTTNEKKGILGEYLEQVSQVGGTPGEA